MIQYLLAAIGGYLIGDSMKDSQKFADGGETDGIFYGVVDSNNKLVFQSKNEKEAKMVSNTYEGSIVKSYKGKAKIHKYADGGETEDDMELQFIDYKGKTIMFEPHFKEYFSNDIEFKTLDEAKKYIDAGSPDPSWQKFAYSQGLMADGGDIKRNHLGVEDRTRPKFPDFLTEVKYDAKTGSKRNKTYVFHDIWNKGVSENYSWGTDEDLEYMQEKGLDFKVVATYDKGEEITNESGMMAKGGDISIGNPLTEDNVDGAIIMNIANPEWGTWKVLRKYDDRVWEIRSSNGNTTTLFLNEFKFWKRINYADGGMMADGGSVKNDDGYVVYFGVFRGRGLTPVITEYYENLADAEKSVEDKKAKKEKGWKVKALNKMPVNSEVRMGKDNPNYDKVENTIHSEERVTEFFKGKDSFYKKDFFWVKPQGYEWDNWQLVKK